MAIQQEPAFDPGQQYVARVAMVLAGRRLLPGDPIDPSNVRTRTLDLMLRMRPPRIETTDSAAPYDHDQDAGQASGQTSDAGHGAGGVSLPNVPAASAQEQAGPARSDREAESPASPPNPRREALPDGWRDLHGNTLRHLAKEIAGRAPTDKADIFSILEGYERGRAA